MADKFVKMIKDGETIEVNPLCVKDHESLGWVAVSTEAKAEKEAAKAEAKAEKEKG